MMLTVYQDPATRRLTHTEAKEQVKRLKLQEASLKQLEEQQEKLVKNLENKEDENRKKENDEHEENTGLRNYLSRGLACP
jgi:predicted RNase H-like nuclease (RuvC/YqgF family)